MPYGVHTILENTLMAAFTSHIHSLKSDDMESTKRRILLSLIFILKSFICLSILIFDLTEFTPPFNFRNNITEPAIIAGEQ